MHLDLLPKVVGHNTGEVNYAQTDITRCAPEGGAAVLERGKDWSA